MTIYLVRHAKAGERGNFDGDDRLRPLSARGHLQTRGLLERLQNEPFERIVSSPYVRCMETVVPLAGFRGLAIEPSDALAEGATLEESLALLRKHVSHGAVFSTHGDVMPMLLEHYALQGVDIGPTPQWPKGCTWVLETDSNGDVHEATYVPPPPG